MDSQWSSDQYFMRDPEGEETSNSKHEKFKELDSITSDSSFYERYRKSQGDMVNWGNHTAENLVGNDCSEFLNDFEEADFSLTSDYTNWMLEDKSNGFDQTLTNPFKADNGLTSVEIEAKSEHSRTTKPESGATGASGSSIARSDTDGSSSSQKLSSAPTSPRLRKQDVANSTQLQVKSVAEGNLHNLLAPTTIRKANQKGVPRLRSSKKTSAAAGSNVIGSSHLHSKNAVHDFEEEPVRSKKHSVCRGMDAKKTHAAEVHNLSERRRRDKINEKMHGLRDIVPNCSKVDKASVLDEAIEYIKALQKQVQISSMQNGVFMPQMAAPSGPRQNHALNMAHLAPKGIGMGMGVGFCYGMGVYDINGIPRFPIIPLQAPIHGPQFPCSSVSETGIFGVPGPTNLQMFGMPGMVSSASKPCPPPSGSPGSPVLAAAIALPSHSKDQQHQTTQVKDCSEQSPQGSNHALVDNGNESLNPVSMELESARLSLTTNSWMTEMNIACEVSSDDDLQNPLCKDFLIQ